MRTPKLTTLDLAVLLHVSGGANSAKADLKLALDTVKKSVEDHKATLASTSSSTSTTLMPMMMMMMNRGSGSSGAPAQVGVPDATPAAPLAAAPATPTN